MYTEPSTSVILHLYYSGSWQMIKPKIRIILERSSQVIITYCIGVVREEVDLPHAIFLKVPNIGKDIGGKLAAIDHYLKFGVKTKLLIFLHDKLSPQTINADYWLNSLYEIFSKEKISKILNLLDQQANAGLIGSAIFLKNEYIKSQKQFETTNNAMLHSLIAQYGLYCKKYDYIAGTVFIVRSSIYEDFFSKNAPLDIRTTLERGNVLDLQEGTATHSWERLFCFIAEHYGYKVCGV